MVIFIKMLCVLYMVIKLFIILVLVVDVGGVNLKKVRVCCGWRIVLMLKLVKMVVKVWVVYCRVES